MLNRIRFFFNKWLVSKNLAIKSGSEPSFSYQQVKEIGLIYNAENPTEANQVMKFADELKSDGKKVTLLGFINNQQKTSQIEENQDHILFSFADLNYFFLPKAEKINQFLNQKFDLLLNVYQHNFEFLFGLVSLSKAKYKVGAQFNLATRIFDLTVDTKTNKDIYFLAKQMEFYLKVI